MVPKELKRPQWTSKYLKKIELLKPVLNADSTITRTVKKKNRLKGGPVHEIDDNKDENSDESLHTNSNL